MFTTQALQPVKTARQSGQDYDRSLDMNMTQQYKNNNKNGLSTAPNNRNGDDTARVSHCGFTETPDDQAQLCFSISGTGALMALSELLPVLENMGARVVSANSTETFTETDGSGPGWRIRLKLLSDQGELISNRALQHNFKKLFLAVIRGEVENDGFNRLVTLPEISIDELVLLRAVARYLLQINVPFSQTSVEQVLSRHSQITVLLTRLFRSKFSLLAAPSGQQRQAETAEQQRLIVAGLDQVSRRDDDRILRSYFSVLNAMVRTNFYQSSGPSHALKALSFKLRAKQIETIPQPAPEFETFVYSPRIEGVHLRGGKVSRGGIRWSDRREDFRTEILGLVKAQMVKNSVIVPVGAKGGFVIRQGGADQLAARYSEFIAALLDITDNLKAGGIIPPVDVVRYDDDDPYLVVAADKGTAALSDTANAIAGAYSFWLGDAFASGGANGYDHKKMGITARGAWQSTRRLFKELGIDSQRQEFTTIAIGDMSGDVFGNGMLLSEHIRLVAAFNHQHIFIDPNPDAATSFAERKRLFNLPRSSWGDYSEKLISAGGGVFPRSCKQIPLTRQIRSLCRISPDIQAISPDELIRRLLSAPADLLWNGGIGTYVKSGTESHQDAGDRANDGVRVNATDLRARIIVEGGNLGLTQSARIEFAKNGGRITTDAIDNSGGVDCSDHEVNIKILLQQLLEDRVIDLPQRNQLLESMTDEVAELVLRNNYQQSKMLSQSNQTSALFIDKHARLIQLLEKKQLLNRELENLPDNASMNGLIRTGQGLTRPEIAVLLASSKTYLFNKLVDSDLIEDKLISRELFNYFPSVLRQRYPDYIRNHPLAREILAAQITNQVANRMGSTFCNNLLEVDHRDAALWVKSHIAAREIFGTADLGQQIEALEFSVPNSLQMDLFLRLHFPMEKAAHWLQEYEGEQFDTRTVVEKFTPWVNYLRGHLPKLLSENEAKTCQQAVSELTEQGIPVGLAEQLSALDYLYHALDIAIIASSDVREMERVVTAYFRLNGELDLFWLRRYLNSVPIRDRWYRKAKDVMARHMDQAVRNRARQLLNQFPSDDSGSSPCRSEHYSELLNEIRAQQNPSLATVTVAIEQINAPM